MAQCSVTLLPQQKSVSVLRGSTILEAASRAEITINNLCGGEGVCGRCKMIVKEGQVSGGISEKISREEIRKGYVLSCLAVVESDLLIEIPDEILAQDKSEEGKTARRFNDLESLAGNTFKTPSPLIQKVYVELEPPTLENNTADHQRLCEALHKNFKDRHLEMGLKTICALPPVLREGAYKVTATLAERGSVLEVINVEPGNTSASIYMVIIDIGTTTIVAHLIDAANRDTLDASACFNSQGIHGREVTSRMIASERKGMKELHNLLARDLNQLITNLARTSGIRLSNIYAVVCAGNTAMSHFLLSLPVENIRRNPYVAASVEPPPVRALEAGLVINPRGLLYTIPGISGWVGGDLTAGILATGMYKAKDLCLLVDIGTNGEVIVGNREWLISCSASAGPALEGASVECGIRAEDGAVEKVFFKDNDIAYATIGNKKPKGLCGSGIIDIIAVLLEYGIINRSGKIVNVQDSRIKVVEGVKRFILATGDKTANGHSVYITETDIQNVITAKGAIYAAMRIIVQRLDLKFSDIKRLYIAGGFGKFINIKNAINIGLIPPVPLDRIEFVGNTSLQGAKLAALYKDAYDELKNIERNTTYYDLMGAEDYVEEFTKAMFLPHTDIEEFQLKAEL